MPSSGMVCLCAAGYRDSDTGDLCGACAEGFQGYPNCNREASEDFKEREDGAGGSNGCSLPVLPRYLNGRGMLEEGSRGALHLQGDYWLDLRSRGHIMHVSISSASLLHLRLDMGALAGKLGVAVAIERLGATGAARQAGTSRKGAGGEMELHDKDEESAKAGGNRAHPTWQSMATVEKGGRMAVGEGYVEAVLQAPVSDGPNPSPSDAASSQRYRILLAYEVLGEIHGGKEEEMCSSLGLQLAITPLSSLKTLASQVEGSCPSDARGRIDVPEHTDVSPAGWSMNGTFYIGTKEPGTRVMRMGKAIQPITLRIPAVPGKVARLSASVGYRFEMSSFGLLLEAEQPGGNWGDGKPLCQARIKPGKAESGEQDSSHERDEGPGGSRGDAGKEQMADGQIQGAGAPPKDEWGDWKAIGKQMASENRPAKAYYEDDVDVAGEKGRGLTGKDFDEEDDQDREDHRGTKQRRPDRDGAYDFHDLIHSALSDLANKGHGVHQIHFPAMGALPGGLGFHHFQLPFGHLRGHTGSADSGGDHDDRDRGNAGGPGHMMPMSRLFAGHPFADFFDDSDDDDEDDMDRDADFERDGKEFEEDGKDEDDKGDQDAFGRRHRRKLLSVDNGGVVASSVLVERNEKHDQAHAGKINVETMLRQPAAGSEDMFACRRGRERYNQNVIEEFLPPGTYTLWLVRDTDLDQVLRGRTSAEAEPGLDGLAMRCLAFDLAVSVTFDDPPPTPVTCAARTLPAALHEPGFLGPSGSRIHIQDTFYMRQARLSRRHFIDFTVRGQGASVLRAHVESQESVDIRLSVWNRQLTPGSTKATPTLVDVENPHVVGGLRGDAILALLQPGSYQLQLEFINPGGAPGFPAWDLGEGNHGQGRQGGGRDGCEVLDLELALMPVEDLGADEGFRQECPGEGQGVERVPSLLDVAGGRSALRIGDSFNVPAEDGGSAPGESMLQRLREDRESIFWAQTRNGSRGFVIASYPLEVEALAVLRAGLRSDFVHDDLVLDVVDSAGRLVFTGAHRRSYNHIQSLIQPGRYTLKIRQSLSAAEVLASKTNERTLWVKKTDAKGKSYYFNTASQTSQWHRPPEMSGSNCARFAFWVALESFSAADDCHVAADAMRVPNSLDSPGMLGSHRRAYVQGLFAIGGQQGLVPAGEGNSMHQTIRYNFSKVHYGDFYIVNVYGTYF
jgi:hypothetical protein